MDAKFILQYTTPVGRTSDLVEDDDFDNSSVDSDPQSKDEAGKFKYIMNTCFHAYTYTYTAGCNGLEKCQ